jgi:hypothetical protein
MPKVTFTADECRRKAQEFRELAERAPRPVVRNTLLEIASTWDRLAVTLERQQRHNGGEH